MLGAPRIAALVLCLVAVVEGHGARASDPDTARLQVDFVTGTVRAAARDHEIAFAVDADSLRSDLEVLADLFAHGDDAASARHAIGLRLLGPLAPVLAAMPHWIIDPGTSDVPGPLAVVSALVLPWDSDGAPVMARHVVSFAWPAGVPDREPALRSDAPEERTGILLVAPFERDVEPSKDDPDTLRRALRAGASRVDLLPRNELAPADLRRALADARPALVWVRATAAQWNGLLPGFGPVSDVLAWTPPSRAIGARLALRPESVAFEGSRPRALIVQLWAGAETPRGPSYRAIVDALARGRTVGEAVAASQRSAAEAGSGAAIWAGWAVVGDAQRTVHLHRAPWLRRVFGPR